MKAWKLLVILLLAIQFSACTRTASSTVRCVVAAAAVKKEGRAALRPPLQAIRQAAGEHGFIRSSPAGAGSGCLAAYHYQTERRGKTPIRYAYCHVFYVPKARDLRVEVTEPHRSTHSVMGQLLVNDLLSSLRRTPGIFSVALERP